MDKLCYEPLKRSLSTRIKKTILSCKLGVTKKSPYLTSKCFVSIHWGISLRFTDPQVPFLSTDNNCLSPAF